MLMVIMPRKLVKYTEAANSLNNVEPDPGEDALHVGAGGGVPLLGHVPVPGLVHQAPGVWPVVVMLDPRVKEAPLIGVRVKALHHPLGVALTPEHIELAPVGHQDGAGVTVATIGQLSPLAADQVKHLGLVARLQSLQAPAHHVDLAVQGRHPALHPNSLVGAVNEVIV